MDSPLLPLVCVWLDVNFPKIGAKLRKRTNCSSTPEISLEDVFAKYALLLAQVRPQNGKKRKMSEQDGSQTVKCEPDRKKTRTKELVRKTKEKESSSSSSDSSTAEENTTKETSGANDKSSDSSSSSSSSEDESDAPGEGKGKITKNDADSDSDSDDSSSSEDEKVKKKSNKSVSDSDSESSSSSSSDEDKVKKVAKKKTSRGSDSDDSSDDDGDNKTPSSSSDDSSSDSDSDDESLDSGDDKSKKKIRNKKKKVLVKIMQKPSNKPKRGKQSHNRPFQRVKADKVNFINDKLKDNRYNVAESFGRKASETLLKVKGKDFIKSKNKHKRKSFFGGGRIDMGVRSIKF